jgi:hypothetical protein
MTPKRSKKTLFDPFFSRFFWSPMARPNQHVKNRSNVRYAAPKNRIQSALFWGALSLATLLFAYFFPEKNQIVFP